MQRNDTGGPGPGLWAADLGRATAAPQAWLWQGYLARGNVTLLTSLWKSGKTTLVAVQLARLRQGGELAGLPLAAGRAAVVSEESPEHWRARHEKLDFGNHVCFFCRPFLGKPRPAEWLSLLDRLAEVHARHGLDLVVLDPLAAFLPGRGENNAGVMLEALMPLQRLTAQGVSVLVLHHPRKGDSPAGQAARGSGALAGYVDILLEMKGLTQDGADRRRLLRAFSRHEATPRQLVIELDAAGTDYRACGEPEDVECAQHWGRLQAVLAQAPDKLTRREVLAAWPDAEAPAEVTLWRWLERAVARGLLCRDGTGQKRAPFRYWLPGQEEVWKSDPLSLSELPELPPLSDWELLRAAKKILNHRAGGARP